MRVAIVHPWFLALGGAEQTVGVLADMYPEADIFTLFCDRGALPAQLIRRRIISSNWNWIPFKYKFYRHLLPLYPRAIEAIDLRGYDLVISSDSCITKGLLLDENTTHVCFCHSPMRCLYDQYRESLNSLPRWARPIFKFVAHRMRLWDYVAAQRVTGFAANSQYIAKRIQTYYGLRSEVTYAPVDTLAGRISSDVDDFYLCVGRLVTSKRVDIAIEACNRMGRRLVIVGRGREMKRLKRIAGPTIQFAEWVSKEQLAGLYAECRAVLFPAKEDFGIVPLECQSYGRPVIAFGEGGALETVIPGVTGIHFSEQSAESLVGAIREFEREQGHYNPSLIQANARSFDTSTFRKRFSAFVEMCIEAKRSNRHWAEVAFETTPAKLALDAETNLISALRRNAIAESDQFWPAAAPADAASNRLAAVSADVH
jgi:glycosyltransferase involved in cell wall biosynthesis